MRTRKPVTTSWRPPTDIRSTRWYGSLFRRNGLPKAPAEVAPQWGDGAFTRDFAVGREAGLREKWKIFELGMM
ncbi:MAG: hypothetical protein ACLTW9_09100 [Enterocloster sp.]